MPPTAVEQVYFASFADDPYVAQLKQMFSLLFLTKLLVTKVFDFVMQQDDNSYIFNTMYMI